MLSHAAIVFQDFIRYTLSRATTSRIGSRRVRSADRIYVLNNGCVVESGIHEELLAAAGTYAELFTLQASPYQ